MDIHKKKQKNVEPGSPNSDIEGDAWLFSFITRGSYLIVAYEIGKRTRESCKRLFEKVFDRVQLPFPNVKIQIFSDGNDIETTDIENMNSICRERLGRFVRKTKCFSKKNTRLINAFELLHFYWNFMDKLTKTETPAMLEGLADHQWNWEQFFDFSLSILN